MKRRAVMAGALALCAGGGSPSQAASLTALFADQVRARRLGRAYLDGLGEPPSQAALAGLIWRDLPPGFSLRSRVAALVRQDFAQGELACVEGWLLARTEARLCAGGGAQRGRLLRVPVEPPHFVVPGLDGPSE